jgi:hypothetical protein
MIRTLILVVVLAGLVRADKVSSPGFDKIKALAGTWESDGMTITYRLTSGGHTVMETIAPGTEKEMVTMYYEEGDNLVLVHYCAMGNQPRMKAPKDVKGDSIHFTCTGGGNLNCAKDTHMHSVTLTFQDPDHIKEEWSSLDEGKPGKCAAFVLARKKS